MSENAMQFDITKNELKKALAFAERRGVGQHKEVTLTICLGESGVSKLISKPEDEVFNDITEIKGEKNDQISD